MGIPPVNGMRRPKSVDSPRYPINDRLFEDIRAGADSRIWGN